MHDAYKNHKVLKKTSLWNLSLNFLYQIEIDSQTTDNTIRFSPLLQWIFDFKCILFFRHQWTSAAAAATATTSSTTTTECPPDNYL